MKIKKAVLKLKGMVFLINNTNTIQHNILQLGVFSIIKSLLSSKIFFVMKENNNNFILPF